MTSIKWNPVAEKYSGLRIKAPRPQGAFESSRWSDDFQRSRTAIDLNRNSDPLTRDLKARLEKFDSSLKAVEWPGAENPLFNGRLVTRDPALKEKVEGTILGNNSESEAVPYYKYFSRGLDGNQPTELAEGEYKFTLSHAGTSKTLSVDVESGWTNQDVIQAVAGEINDSALKVQAEVVTQTSSGSRIKGNVSTGTSLAIAVNGAYSDQDVSLRDTQGHLLGSLNLRTTSNPVGAASIKRYDLNGPMAARPSKVVTRTMDPGAEAGLNPGVHSLNYSFGPDTGTIEFNVADGDTWRDALNKMANAVNSAQEYFKAEVVKVDRPVYFEEDNLRVTGEGVALSIEADSPKVGMRMTLSGGEHSGSGTFTVTGGAGTYTAQVDQAQYESIVSGSRATVSATTTLPNPLAEYTEYYLIRNDDSATEGFEIEFATSKADAESFNGIALTTAGSGTFTLDMTLENAVDELGLNLSAAPGTDAKMVVNGREKIRSPGTFSEDDGRVLITQEDNFGETLPLKVEDAFDVMDSRISDVTTSYNALHDFLRINSDRLEDGLVGDFTGPIRDNSTDLKWVGLREIGTRKTLWFDHDTFYSALGSDPERARELLVGDQGLFTKWGSTASSLLDNPVEDILREKSSLPNPFAPDLSPRTEFAVEKSNQLLDLFDSAKSPGTKDVPVLGLGIVDSKG